MPPSLKLFVNYRRADHADFVEHLRTHFMYRYGRENVFMDFDTIPPFVRFEEFIKEKVRECDAVVAVIGPDWLNLLQEREAAGKPDYVRIELSEALRCGKVIAPICIHGAHLPQEDEIPAELRPIFERNIPDVRPGRDLLNNVGWIMEGLESELEKAGRRRRGIKRAAPEVTAPDQSINVQEVMTQFYEARGRNDWPEALLRLAQLRASGAVLPGSFKLQQKETEIQERLKQEEEARRRQEVAEYLYTSVRVMVKYEEPKEVIQAALEEIWGIVPGYDPDDFAGNVLGPIRVEPIESEVMPELLKKKVPVPGVSHTPRRRRTRIDSRRPSALQKWEPAYYYPNKWARIVLTSAEEIMGDRGVAALLNMANMKQYIDNYPPDNMRKEFPFEEIGYLQQAIWDMFGSHGARVFATRAGEQIYKDGLSQFKSVAAAAQIAMKVESLDAKAKIGLEFFSKFFNAVSDQVIEIDEDANYWIWRITRCPNCWGRKSDEPVCHLAVGVLQAAFAWMSDGRKFHIIETECKAKGDKNCVFKIEKIPVE